MLRNTSNTSKRANSWLCSLQTEYVIPGLTPEHRAKNSMWTCWVWLPNQMMIEILIKQNRYHVRRLALRGGTRRTKKNLVWESMLTEISWTNKYQECTVSMMRKIMSEKFGFIYLLCGGLKDTSGGAQGLLMTLHWWITPRGTWRIRCASCKVSHLTNILYSSPGYINFKETWGV